MALPCSAPPSVSNGFYVIAKGTYQNGDQIAYYCKMGYELDGTQTRSCDGSSGAWDGATPKCTKVTTTTIITTTTTAPTSQISVSILVLIPFLLLLLSLISLGTWYIIKRCYCAKGCKKQSFWIDGDDHVQYGYWYGGCNTCCHYLYAYITCQRCKKAQLSQNLNGDVWSLRNGGLWSSQNGRKSASSRVFSSSIWSSTRSTKSESPWKPNLDSVPEKSQTTISDL
ncbi:uncharacterized protein LOC133187615 [Saccostrea echinata]|uniref:uncharacterized protein LOC133187615 n=1 Tax=Saccostrea echinata TaxID=191078 RepID=UPI002A806E24|nr:uncharacterized protein LOC133187615 [Saccostrea echinata]